MRIRRCASRLLGSSAAAPALPGFELPPPSPPPAHEPHAAGFVAAPVTSSSSSLVPCELSLSPWDLMDQLHLSDPREEKIFLENYLVAVAWRASWLFHPSMPPAGSIKEEDDMAVDMVDGVIFELRVAASKRARKKYQSKPKKGEAKEDAEGSDPAGDGGGGGARVWACKKNDGKGWFCRRPVSQPDSLCPYHSDQKAPGSSKPRKRAAAYAGEGFYYYAGFGPSRSKRHRVSSSTGGVPEPSPAGQKEEAPPDPEEHIGVTMVQAKADGAEHKATPLAHVDEPRCGGTAGIAGCDEESSDDDVVESREVKIRKSPLKKRWRKPVKARSLKSLM